MATVVTGDTVRLKCEFKDFDEALVDPTGVVVKIYDDSKAEVSEFSPTKDSTGKYYYDYTIPAGTGRFYFEYSGEIGGSAVVGRKELVKKWV